eukprot:SAG11_NODE_4526_length_1864_cov_1.312748_3_plen_100_part_00
MFKYHKKEEPNKKDEKMHSTKFLGLKKPLKATHIHPMWASKVRLCQTGHHSTEHSDVTVVEYDSSLALYRKKKGPGDKWLPITARKAVYFRSPRVVCSH